MQTYDLLVIGSGPSGQRAAIQASKAGKRVALAERTEVVGGVCINTGTIPSKTLREAVMMGVMNERLQELTDERFVTAFYGVFDRQSRVFRYATAGHPHPLLYESKTGTVKQLCGQGFLLGVVPDEVYTEREVVLEPGDKICFYTDGVIEARNVIDEMFNVDRLIQCLQDHSSQPSSDVLRGILNSLSTFCDGTPYGDDVTRAVVDIVAA